MSYAIDLAMIICFGVPAAILASCAGYLGSCLLKIGKEKTPFEKILFNIAQFIINIFISGTVYYYIRASFPPENTYIILATALAALSYFVVNFSLVTFLFAFLQRKSVLSVWLVNVKWAVPNFLALAPIGYILAFIYTGIGLMGIFLFFLPLLLARHSFKLYMDMREMYLKSIHSLASTIDAKDHYTSGHSQRVARYILAICAEMNLPEDYIENLKDLALLHDIGKIAIPENILNKPGKLEQWELTKMKTHPNAGYEIIKQITFLKESESVKHHHERLDGSGYPGGLKGEEIPLGARIIAVADSYDAMTTDRPYRKGMHRSAALEEVKRCSGTQFDPEVVAAFVRAFPKLEGEGFRLNLALQQQKTEG
ncbi:MAG: HD-GYP domain-containing protein [Desulfitobacteriaceae bacterium]|nr:HD-GYP domain-containing protein [Desulfitobacteriaceae bacterium]